jgi:hypothetical protein
MDHDNEGGGWKMWIPMILCCAVMITIFVLLAAGVLTLP